MYKRQIHLIPVALLLVTIQALPFLFLLGVPAVAYFSSLLYVGIFKRVEPEEQVQDGEDVYKRQVDGSACRKRDAVFCIGKTGISERESEGRVKRSIPEGITAAPGSSAAGLDGDKNA